MSCVKVLTGNIFTSQCQTLVNTVNCVGVMGAGLALECRLRWPAMFNRYVELCAEGAVRPGRLWLYRDSAPWLLNFPTKKHWRQPSEESYLLQGLGKFVQTYQQKGIESVAFPLLGADRGGLEPQRVLALMVSELEQCQIPVEIYRYDPTAPDDLYQRFKQLLQESDDATIAQATGIQTHRVALLREATQSPAIRQLNQLARCRGIGDKTLERAFALTRMDVVPTQAALW